MRQESPSYLVQLLAGVDFQSLSLSVVVEPVKEVETVGRRYHGTEKHWGRRGCALPGASSAPSCLGTLSCTRRRQMASLQCGSACGLCSALFGESLCHMCCTYNEDELEMPKMGKMLDSLVWEVSCVPTTVSVELTSVTETFLAHSTSKGSLPRVPSKMCHVALMPHEPLTFL